MLLPPHIEAVASIVAGGAAEDGFASEPTRRSV